MANKAADKKVLNRVAKQVGLNAHPHKEVGLKEQYSIIREDLVKLRDDVEKGFVMTKSFIVKNVTVSEIISRVQQVI